MLLDLEILKRNLKFRFLLYSPCSSVFQFIEIKLWDQQNTLGTTIVPWAAIWDVWTQSSKSLQSQAFGFFLWAPGPPSLITPLSLSQERVAWSPAV